MDLRIEDIPYNLHLLVDIVGMDKFMEITKLYGGNNVYIPKYSCVIKSSRNRQIISEFNGANTQDLAYKYNMTYNHIRNIVKG